MRNESFCVRKYGFVWERVLEHFCGILFLLFFLKKRLNSDADLEAFPFRLDPCFLCKVLVSQFKRYFLVAR